MKNRWAFAAFVAAFTLASPVLAQSADFPTREGAERFAEGNKLFTEQKYEAARLKYLEALAVAKSKNLLFNLAKTEGKLGRWADAYGHYRAYLAFKDLSVEDRLEAEKISHELEGKIGRLHVVAPAGSHVQVDGRDLGEAPFPEAVGVETGPHVVKWGTEQKSVTCGAGVVVEVKFEKGGDTPVTPPPKPNEERGSWLVPAVLAGVGVVGMGVGVGLGAASASKGDDTIALFAAGACRPLGSAACQAAQDTESSGSSLATGSVVAYVAGGAFLGAAVISALVVKPWATREAKVAFVPGIGGAMITGKF